MAINQALVRRSDPIHLTKEKTTTEPRPDPKPGAQRPPLDDQLVEQLLAGRGA